MWSRLRRLGQAGPGNAPAALTPPLAQVPTRLSVLMVCSGNICRSPTAEAVLRAKLQRAGVLDVVVDSAGTHGFHVSEAPDPRAMAAGARRGYDLSALRARPVVVEDFQRFDWLLAMDQGHMSWLGQRRPQGAVAQMGLLMDPATRYTGVAEVPDPYYGGPAGFERVLDLVEDACEGWVARLRVEAAP
jgi:protein-tyrosine phosphatase